MASMRFYTVLILLLSLFSMQPIQADEIIRIKVKENKGACTGVAPMECLLVKSKESKGWTFFYSEIKDFQYEEGFRYTLLVHKKKRENVPADASIYSYELVKIIKKRKKKIAPKAQASAIDYLAKQIWKLIQMKGIIQEASPVYMVFDQKKGMVKGISGCNRFFGSYRMEGDQISFDKIAGTLMTCAPEIGQLEADFVSILRMDDLHFDIADQTLNIYQGDDLVLIFGRSLL